MYEEGKGVTRDYVQAYMWFKLVGPADSVAAKNRDRVAAKMTPTQIAEAQKLAREWKPKYVGR
jgi:TPR repeat protein